MKLFLDTAHIPTIKQYAEMGIIDGVTTNPSHMSKEGKNPTKIIKEICKTLPEGDISVEVTYKKPNDVYKQALEIAKLAPNITVKIPCHQDYYEVIKRLVDKDIPINVTLLFSLIQGLFMAKLRVKYISPFIGRLDDIDENGIALIADLRDMLDNYGYGTRLLAASIRSIEHLHECIEYGADVATVPVEILKKALTHPLTDKGMKLFDTDWAKLKVTRFP